MASSKTLCVTLVLFSYILLILAQTVPTNPTSSGYPVDVYQNVGEVVLTAEGPATFYGELSIQGPLTVNGAATISTGFTADGNSNFNTLAVSNDLNAMQNVRTSTFRVDSETSLMGNTYVGSLSDFTLGRPTVNSGDAKVTNFNADAITIQAGSGPAGSGSVFIDGSIVNIGQENGTSTVEFVGGASQTGSASTLSSSNQVSAGNIQSGSTVIQSTTASNLDVRGTLNANTINVNENANADSVETGNLSVGSSLNVTGQLTAQVARISEGLVVSGSTQFRKVNTRDSFDVRGDQQTTGDTNVQGGVTAGSLSVAGDATLTGNRLSLGSSNESLFVSSEAQSTTFVGQDATCADGGDLTVGGGSRSVNIVSTDGFINLGGTTTNNVSIGGQSSDVAFERSVSVTSDLLVIGSLTVGAQAEDFTITLGGTSGSNLAINGQNAQANGGDLLLAGGSDNGSIYLGGYTQLVSISSPGFNTTISNLNVSESSSVAGSLSAQGIRVSRGANAADLEAQAATFAGQFILADQDTFTLESQATTQTAIYGQPATNGDGGDVNFISGRGVNGGDLSVSGNTISIANRYGSVAVGNNGNGETSVTGSLGVQGTLAVAKNLVLGNGNPFAINGEAGSDIHIVGQSAAGSPIGGKTVIESDDAINVQSKAQAGSYTGEVVVNSLLSVTSGLSVNEDLIVDEDLTVSGGITLGNSNHDFQLRRLTNPGRGTETTIIGQNGANGGGSLNIASGSGNTQAGDINIAAGSGAGASNDGKVNIDATSSLISNVTQIGPNKGSVNFGNLQLSGDLSVAQDSALFQASFTSLNVQGKSKLGSVSAQQIQANRSIDAAGVYAPSATSELGQNLIVSGNAATQNLNVNSFLNVEEATEIEGALVTAALSVFGATTVGGDFAANGNVEVDGKLMVSGAASLVGVASVGELSAKNAIIGAVTADQAKVQHAAANNVVAGSLTGERVYVRNLVADSGFFENDLSVASSVSINSNLSTGSLNVQQQLNAGSLQAVRARVYADLSVSGSLSAESLATGELTVTGQANLIDVSASGNGKFGNVISGAASLSNPEISTLNANTLDSRDVVVEQNVATSNSFVAAGDFHATKLSGQGITNVLGGVYVKGLTSISGDQIVPRSAEFGGQLTTNTLSAGYTSVSDTAYISGTLNADRIDIIGEGYFGNINTTNTQFGPLSVLNTEANNTVIAGSLYTSRANLQGSTFADDLEVNRATIQSLTLNTDAVSIGDGRPVTIRHVSQDGSGTNIGSVLVTLSGGSGDQLGGDVILAQTNSSSFTTQNFFVSGGASSNSSGDVIIAAETVNFGADQGQNIRFGNTTFSNQVNFQNQLSFTANAGLSAENAQIDNVAVGTFNVDSLTVQQALANVSSFGEVTVSGSLAANSLSSSMFNAENLQASSLDAAVGLVRKNLTFGNTDILSGSDIQANGAVRFSSLNSSNIDSQQVMTSSLTASNADFNNVQAMSLTVNDNSTAQIDRDLMVSGAAVVGGSANFSGSLEVAKNFNANGNIQSTENAAIRGDVSVFRSANIGTATFNGDVIVDADLSTNSSVAAENVFVGSDAAIANSVSVGADTQASYLVSSGSSNLQNVRLVGTLTADQAQFDGLVQVQGTIGAATSNVLGQAQTESLRVRGAADAASGFFRGGLEIRAGASATETNVGRSLYAGDELIAVGNLDISESANLGDIDVFGTMTAASINALNSNIDGSLNSLNSIKVQGSSNSAGLIVDNIIRTEDFYVQGSASVGSGFFATNVNVAGYVRVENTTVSDTVTFESDVKSDDTIFVGDGFSVLGTANFGTASVNGRLTTKDFNTTSLNSERLYVEGDIISSSSVSGTSFSTATNSGIVTAETLNTPSFVVNGAVSSAGFLSVGCAGAQFNGQLRVGSEVSALGNVNVAGSEYVEGSLSIGGNAELGDVIVAEDAVFSGSLNAQQVDSDGTAKFGAILISGNATFADLQTGVLNTDTILVSTAATNGIVVSGDALLGNDAFLFSGVQSGNGAIFDNSLSVGSFLNADNTRVAGDVTVIGDLDIAGDLSVSGAVISNQNVRFTGVVNASRVDAKNVRVDSLEANSVRTESFAGLGSTNLQGGLTASGMLNAGSTNVAGAFESGSLFVEGQVVTSNFAADQLSVSQNSDFNNLNVNGVLRIRSPLAVGQNFTVTGAASIGDLTVGDYQTGALSVESDTSIRGNVEITGSASVACDQADVRGNLNVGDAITVARDVSIGQAIQAQTINTNLVVAGDLQIDGVTVGNQLYVSGDVSVVGLLTAQNALINSNLTAASLAATDASVSGNLYAEGLTATTINLQAAAVGNNLQVTGAVTIAQEATIGGNLTTTTLQSAALQVGDILQAGTSAIGSLNVLGSVGAASSINAQNVRADSFQSSTISTSSSIRTTGLEVNQDATIGRLDVQNNILASSIQVGGDLAVARDFNVAELLSVEGAANFGSLSLSDDSTLVTGQASVAGTFGATGLDGVSIRDDLSVSESANLNNLNSATAINTQCLSVTGNAQFNSDVNIADTLTASSGASSKFLNVTTDSNFADTYASSLNASSVNANGNSYVEGSSQIQGDAVFAGLYVSGDNYNSGNINTPSLNVDGKTFVAGVDATGEADFYDDVDITGSANLGCGTNIIFGSLNAGDVQAASASINNDLITNYLTAESLNVEGGIFAGGDSTFGTAETSTSLYVSNNAEFAEASTTLFLADDAVLSSVAAGSTLVQNMFKATSAFVAEATVNGAVEVESAATFSSLTVYSETRIAGDFVAENGAEIGDSLYVSGKINQIGDFVAAGVIDAKQATTQTAEFSETTVTNSLRAFTITTSNLDVTRTATVEALTGNAAVTGETDFNGDVSANADVNVAGITQTRDDVLVSGNLVNLDGGFIGALSVVANGVTFVATDLNTPELSAQGPIAIAGTVTASSLISETAELFNVIVNNEARISGNLNAQVLNSAISMTVTDTQADVIQATQGSLGTVVTGNLAALSIAADSYVANGLVTTDLSCFGETEANSFISGGLTTRDNDNERTNVLTTGLTVNGASYFDCSRSLNVRSSMSVAGPALFEAGFTVAGTFSIGGNINGVANVQFDRVTSGSGNTSDARVSNNLQVGGSATFGTLALSGDSTSNAYNTGSLTAQNFESTGTLTVENFNSQGDAVYSSVNVNGALDSAGAVTVGAAANVNGLLTSTAGAMFENAQTGALTIINDANINGELRVGGTTNFPEQQRFSNVRTQLGNINSIRILNETQVNGNINALDADFGCSGNLMIGGDISVNQASSVRGSADVSRGATINGDINVGLTSTVEQLDVSGPSTFNVFNAQSATVAGLLSVAGQATVNGRLTSEGPINAANTFTSDSFDFSGDVTNTVGNIGVNGNVYANTLNAGDFFVTGSALSKRNVNAVNLNSQQGLSVGSTADLRGNVVVAGGVAANELFVAGRSSITGTLMIFDDASVTGQLTAGDATVRGEISVGGDASTNTLSVFGDTTLRAQVTAGSLNAGTVYADKGVQAFGNVIIGRVLDVSGNLAVGLPINVASGTFFANDFVNTGSLNAATVVFEDGFSLSGPASADALTLSPSLVISSSQVQASAALLNSFSGEGDINIDGELTVTETLSVRGDMTLGNEGLFVNDAEVAGSAFLGGNLAVASSATFAGDLEVQGSVVTASFTVLGTTSIDGDVFVSGDVTASDVSVGGSATTDGALLASEDASVFGNTNVGGAANFDSDLSIQSGAQISGDATFDSLSVGGSLSAGGDAQFAAATTFAGAIDVVGSFESGEVTSGGNVIVSGPMSVGSDYNANTGSLSLAREAIIGADLQLGGANLVIGSRYTTEQFSGEASTVGIDVEVTGSITFNNDLLAEGALSTEADLNVLGSTSVAQTLTVDTVNVANFFRDGHDLSLSGNLVVGGAEMGAIDGSLFVNGANPVRLNGDVNAGGEALFGTEGLAVNGDVAIGSATIGDSLTLDDELVVTGLTSIYSSVLVSESAEVNGEFTVVFDTSVGAELFVSPLFTVLGQTDTGDFTVSESTFVVGNTTVGGDAAFNDGLTVRGSTFIQGSQIIGKKRGERPANVNILGDVTVGSNFTGAFVNIDDDVLITNNDTANIFLTVFASSVSTNDLTVVGPTELLLNQLTVTNFNAQSTEFLALTVSNTLQALSQATFESESTIFGNLIAQSVDIEIGEEFGLSVSGQTNISAITIGSFQAGSVVLSNTTISGPVSSVASINSDTFSITNDLQTLNAANISGSLSVPLLTIGQLGINIPGGVIGTFDSFSVNDFSVGGSISVGSNAIMNTLSVTGTLAVTNIVVNGPITRTIPDGKESPPPVTMNGFESNSLSVAQETTVSDGRAATGFTRLQKLNFNPVDSQITITVTAGVQYYSILLSGATFNQLVPSDFGASVYRIETTGFDNNDDAQGQRITYRYEVGDIILLKGSPDAGKDVLLVDYADVANNNLPNPRGNLYNGRSLMTESLNLFTETLHPDDIVMYMYSPRASIGSADRASREQIAPVEWVKVL